MLGPVRLLAADLLAPVHDGRWRSEPVSSEGERVLGSQVLAQSVWVAGRTDGRLPYSVHAHFLNSGIGAEPVAYRIETVRAGRSSAVLRVDSWQDETILASVTVATGAMPEGGHDWSAAASTGAVGRPEYLGEHRIMTASLLAEFEVRSGEGTMHPAWVRHRGGLPDDPLARVATMAFLSDIGVTYTAHPPTVPPRDRFGSLSLDHALWFHRPWLVGEWLLIDADPITATGRRGLATGAFYDAAGARLASFSQVVLL